MMTAYRAAPKEPKFICSECYRNVAPTPQDCPQCAAPMQPLDDSQVQTDLRARAEARKKQLNGRRGRIAIATAFVVGFGLNLLLLWRGVYGARSMEHATPYEGGANFYFFFFILPFLMSIAILVVLELVGRRFGLFVEPATIDTTKASTADVLRFLGIHR